MKWWGYAIIGAFALGLAWIIHGMHSNSSSSSGIISLTNSANYTLFGNAAKTDGTNGFTLTNLGGPTGFASAADIFSTPVDIAIPYTLHLVVKGVNGAKKLGITGPIGNEDPNNVNNLQFSTTMDISDGLEHTVDLTLPISTQGLKQIAFHIGQNFGTGVVLGNPVGSGVQIIDASLSVTPGANPVDGGIIGIGGGIGGGGFGGGFGAESVASKTRTLVNASSNDLVASSPTITNAKSFVTPATVGDPLKYTTLYPSGNTMDASSIIAAQERLIAAAQSNSAIPSARLVEDAGTQSHLVTPINQK